MFKSTKLVTFDTAVSTRDRAAVIASLKSAGESHAAAFFVEPTLPGVYFGGDIIAHFQFENEAACRVFEPLVCPFLAAPTVSHIDSVEYAGGKGATREPALRNGVYRTLLLCVSPAAELRKIEQFEAEMEMMPHYIPAIRNWQLSRTQRASGTQGWTHVWEQEYSGIEGLMGPYMIHPYHWGRVDRWFDPEHPDGIIDTNICHTFCALQKTIV
jgi:hypothetical protein